MNTTDLLLTIPDPVSLSSLEEKMVSLYGLSSVVIQRILSKKYRKTAANEFTKKCIHDYVERTVAIEKPLRLYVLFGGYKQFRLKSSPYPEWAELFNLQHMIECALYLESIYPPGVNLIYRGDEVATTLLDNYTVEAREVYTKHFRDFIRVFQSHIPNNRNIQIWYERTQDSSRPEKLFPLMDTLFEKHEKEFCKLPSSTQEQGIAQALRNQAWDGAVDLTKLSDSEKRARSRWAYIMHNAFIEADITLSEQYFNDGISITFRRDVPGCIHYNACRNSGVQFWAGEGFLLEKNGETIKTILSYTQIEKLSPEEVRAVELEEDPFKLDTIRMLSSSTHL